MDVENIQLSPNAGGSEWVCDDDHTGKVVMTRGNPRSSLLHQQEPKLVSV